ncbi:MAG TPA: non-canonical purine NTP pyrophosphatase, partial [Desulfobacterales bacterium]|nr:non-canonical purine NTP pyrophosphatase [Desulfobacterales bacterium]
MGKLPILVMATRNSGKTAEIRELLQRFPVEIKSLSDFGPIPEVEEDGDTFDANAY